MYFTIYYNNYKFVLAKIRNQYRFLMCCYQTAVESLLYLICINVSVHQISFLMKLITQSFRNPLLFTLAKEIMFLRPNIGVLYELSFLLKNACQDKDFVQRLCTMVPENAPKMNVKEGILNYNNGIVWHYGFRIALYTDFFRFLRISCACCFIWKQFAVFK